MSNKPTPAQANVLKYLTSFKYIDIYRNIAHRATFAVLLKKGWIEKSGYSYTITLLGSTAYSSLLPDDFIPDRPEYTAAEITSILQSKYSRPWLFFKELRGSTGYVNEQRIDAWTINTWPSSGLHKIAFEIKIYRTDFLQEIKHPEKREFALSVSNEFYFVAPSGLIQPSEIPAECGLIEIKDKKAKIILKAKYRKVKEPTWLFFASLARRLII